MNYLVQFLSVLKKSEIEKLKLIPLSGKEKKLLDLLIIYKNKNLPKDIILEKLQLTESHFYKACSVILDKCYRFLFHNDFFESIRFLSKRDLYQNLKHEILKQEKRYANDLKFNLLAFELLQRGSYKNHEEKLIQHFANQIKNIIQILSDENLKLDFLYFLEIRRMRSKIFELAALQQTEKALFIKKHLLELQKQIVIHQHRLASFHLYHALYNYYNLFKDSEGNPESWLNKALEASEYVTEYIEPDDIINTKAKIAENLYYQSQFHQAINIYIQLKEEYPHIFFEDFYHLTKYVQLCFILDKLEEAEAILNQYFLDYLRILHPSRGTMAAINYSKLFLLQKDFHEANLVLQKARFLNDKNFFLPYEFEIRLLESTLIFLTQDLDFFFDNIKKQFKYLKF